MTGIWLIRDLAVVLVVAGGAAWLCQRLGLSAVAGYLMAGAIIGPYTPPFALVEDLDRIQTLAQLGLVFLIFSIGLNLSLSRLKRLGLSTALATVLSALLIFAGCNAFGRAIGWNWQATFFLAAMLMVSSSAIISRILDELNLTHERGGQLALGATVFEDVVAISMLTLLSSLTRFGEAGSSNLLLVWAGLAAFVVLLALVSLMLVPRLLLRLRYAAEPEIRTLVVGGILLTLAWVAVRLGYSLALGAFVFGVIVGSTRFRTEVERGFDGLRQLFGAVFFVAVGMMVDFRLLWQAWPLVLGLTALAVVLRPVAAGIGFVAVGNSPREALQAGLSLVPLGEFTFIIAQVGVGAGVLDNSTYAVAAGVSLLTALVAPALTRKAEGLSLTIVRLQPSWAGRAITLYHDWLRKLRHRPTAGILWTIARKRLLQIAGHMGLVTALLLVVRPLYAAAARQFQSASGAPDSALPFVFWTLFGIILLAPLISIWRNLSALSMIIADAATFGNPRQPVLRPLLERLLSGCALLLLGLWLLLVLPPGWSLFGPAGGVLILLGVVATVFWRRFVKLQSRFEIRLVDRLHRASQSTSSSAWSDTLSSHTADWDLEIEEVTLPADTIYAGKSLHELALRSRYGCSVIGIDRQGHGILNPGGETILFPRDKLLVLGGHQQLIAAQRELLRYSGSPEAGQGFDDLTMETVSLPHGTTLHGKKLKELDLISRFGVQIGSIRRGTRELPSPGGTATLQSGDELLLLGTHHQINEFSKTLIQPGTHTP